MFAPRPTSPRLAPLRPQDCSDAQRALLAARPDYNIYKTLAHDLEFVHAFAALGRFTLNGSDLPSREREIVMLRMGWLCQCEYEWSQHARIARSSAGFSDADLHRIAEGPDVAGWRDVERALLRMVDELRFDAMVGDSTWQALRTHFTDRQTMAFVLTAGQYQFVSMALNSLGVQLDPGLEDRLPHDVMLPAPALRPASARLKAPRIAVLPDHPQLLGPHAQFDRYVQRDASLPAKTRALLAMRTAWNFRDELGWPRYTEAALAAGFTAPELALIAAGPSAGGWSAEHAVLLQAADDLHHEAFVSDATWQDLTATVDRQQTIALVAIVGATAMTAFMANTLGIALHTAARAH